MNNIITADILFVVATVSGISVSYLAIQPGYEDIQHQLTFLRDQIPRESQRVAQLHLTNLELLLSEERNKALSFNCKFLESELAHLSQLRYTDEAEQIRVTELIEQANVAISEVKEMELCQW